MAKKDILELQRRCTPSEHNITWIVTCLVDADGSVRSVHRQRLVSMREDEYYKVLDKIRQVLPWKKYGDAVVQVKKEFSPPLITIMEHARTTELSEETAAEIIDIVKEQTQSETRQAVIIWKDVYDIVGQDRNRESLDESEDVLEYIGVMTAPVRLDQEGLAYSEKTEDFEAKLRSWVVCAPTFAVLYPSLVERRPDDDTVTMFFGDPAAVNHAFITEQLGCCDFLTRTEAHRILEHIAQRSVGDEGDPQEILGRIGCKLEALDEEELDAKTMKSVCELAGIREDVAEMIKRGYEKYLEHIEPKLTAADLYEKKYASRYRTMLHVREIKQTLTQAAEVIENMSGSEDLTQDMRKLAAGL